ncbi:hypothetical protein COU54_01885 [Candidatus Pacearchaeota archaeon CG10_big_fil_rev_8_21_14_0_10_31_24]|nr:MAG: hypothetical protein COU54_01885 [Candidatus Pacearchaeota archaeon CG10_big_fil_rev_8_21_14_0_10_31_24]
MIEQLRQNVETEIGMSKEIARYELLLRSADPSERKILITSIKSLVASIKIINNSIPSLLNSISLTQKLPSKPVVTSLNRVEFKTDDKQIDVVLNEKDKERFFQELKINSDAVRKIRSQKVDSKLELFHDLQKSRGFVKIANKFFMERSEKLIQTGNFKDLGLDIQRGNFNMLLGSYISVMLLSTVISFFVGVIILFAILFFEFSFTAPMISLGDGDILSEFARFFWILFVVPIATFFFAYSYPSTERASIEKRIDQELPFAVIHMSAISGAGIEPTNIFKIIALSREYPNLRNEIRKLLNQLNLYGYDLVTALNNVARITPSTKLSELLIGLSTTINSGGQLSEFFEKRAETLLVSYRLERQKFTKTAETFMDIYITIAIAAPMIMLLMLVMLSLSDFDIGLSGPLLTFAVIAAVAILNVFFLTMLHLKQPAY